MELNAGIPEGPIEEKWDNHRFRMKLVNPANKRKYSVIVVGTGLAGGAAAATMGELGYRVKAFTFHDSPRRAHSIAAQGGINAAKNYQADGDSVFRLFYDTVKGGDFRSREANVYRLAQVSVNIIDQAVAQGVPFAREYGGLLANRSFGGAQVSRTFYARGQTGQQLLLGAYQALERQVDAGTVTMETEHEMMDVVVIDGVARGIITRNLRTGELERHVADAVVLATGGYSNVFFLSTNAKKCNVTATWRAHRRGAGFANPCYTQIHPTCIPPSGEYQSKLTLMSESLRNDGRIWVPKKKGDDRPPAQIPEDERDYYLERHYPSFGNLAPRDIASRRAKEAVDTGHGVGPLKNGVYLDFKDAIARLGQHLISERYGNLFAMYEKITGEDPYKTPMRIYPAPHYTMGGLWVDYNLQTTVKGLFAIGEANFSDHGANRLGASALMQGLADGYFVMPMTIGNYLAGVKPGGVETSHAAFDQVENEVREKIDRLLSVKGERTVDSFHTELGRLMWDECGMERTAEGLTRALGRIKEIREEFWKNVRVPGEGADLNQELEKAGRVADFLEFAEVMCHDALSRDESCGAHYRPEHVTEDGEAKRDDEHFAYSAVWEFMGVGEPPALHKEPLVFENVQLSQRELQVMNLKLNVWRQKNSGDTGGFEVFQAEDVSPDMSFLEMLDVVNEKIVRSGGVPIAFDHDCREGICGTCGMMINGVPHGPRSMTTACQLHMRSFKDGDELWIEPWQASAFPVLKDLIVDRGAFDRIIQSGGYISVRTGSASDANMVPIPKVYADEAFDAAACIGCGACVAACPNASGMLFTAAKVTHLARIPQGQPERYQRVLRMVNTHDEEGFGNCTNHGACQNACPKGISVDYIAQLNRDLFKATISARPEAVGVGGD